MRASTLLLAGLVAGAGLFTYQVKHRVSLLDQELARAGREMVAEQERLHVLDAEWSLLNEPERLRRLAEQHLALAPMQPRQFAEMADAVRRLPPVGPHPAPPATDAPPTAARPAASDSAAPAAAAPPAAAASVAAAATAAPRAAPRAAPGPHTSLSAPISPAAAGIQQESLPPPPGTRSAAQPRSAPAPARPAVTPAPPPATPAAQTAPAMPSRPVGSALGGSAPALAPPTPWRPAGQ